MLTGARSKSEQEIAQRRERDIGPCLKKASPLRIFDLAKGSLQPQYTLLKAAGHRVCGIDLINRPQLSWTNLAYRVARRIFIWKLSVPAGDLNPETLVCGTSTAPPFRSNSFDLMTSVAAFEHFLYVPAVVAELYRVLRTSGLTWIGIHLFSRLSGGHNVNLSEVPLRTIPSGIEPWDHLRKRRMPFRVPLNCVLREGEKFLTPAIEAELVNYSRDELTCRSYVIIAEKTCSA